MNHELQTTPDFNERMMNLLKEGIGTLLTDEDIRKIIEKGIDNALFQTRTVKSSGWSGTTTELSIVDTVIQRHLEAKLKEQVEVWLKANPEAIEASVNSAIKAGISGCVIGFLDERFNYLFQNGIMNMRSQGLIQFNQP